MKIVLMITGLGMGGAERQVCDLADQFANAGHNIVLISLNGESVIEPKNLSIKLLQLRMRKTPLGFLMAYFKLRKFLSIYRPDVLHSHMVHANIFARLLRITIHIPRLINSAHSTNEGGKVRMLAYRVTNFLADCFTNVSEEAIQAFITRGACKSRGMIVVNNGIDTNRFYFNVEARINKRDEFGLNEQTPLLLAVGRLTEAKDYSNLLQAFALLYKYPFRYHPVLAIAGVGDLQSELEREAESLGISERLRFLGLRKDIPELMSAADLYVMSSAWEGLPLVIGEAMACEKVVVATDAGGCREWMGEIGSIVSTRDPNALSSAIQKMLSVKLEERICIGKSARARIVENYSLQSISEKWMSIYQGSVRKME